MIRMIRFSTRNSRPRTQSTSKSSPKGQPNAKVDGWGALKGLLVVFGIFGLIALIDHQVAAHNPETHTKPLTIAQSEPWLTVTTLPGPSATDIAAATASGGGKVLISDCVLTGQAATTTYTTTKPSKTKTTVNIAGTVQNTTTTAKDYLIELAIRAGSFNQGAASTQLNNVPAGATMSWSAVGTVTNHPTEQPVCTVQEVLGEDA